MALANDKLLSANSLYQLGHSLTSSSEQVDPVIYTITLKSKLLDTTLAPTFLYCRHLFTPTLNGWLVIGSSIRPLLRNAKYLLSLP